ncbi:hypothetical protein CONCODRAFT_137983 [Conidiobolus coronatus NRRL 28638]|uniref:Uncharacterized protein n=1 Tax=Conidiobolus coronatus (strain ATCC 28846 / CBS 209.66 / NRRL 28638) TaxID=796925 RepID=A0A137PBA4_CONC2|nr:hypothetical protein CONCODRAFT_137983 [Conidiobolus coronatus NRRL 28638]|eukprot:KXN72256.1 hypothetical protein CONCODRAFT_137983 [Conidiobolus coronatus NRRL 28638]
MLISLLFLKMRIKTVAKNSSKSSKVGANIQKEYPANNPKSRNKAEEVKPAQVLRKRSTKSQTL